MDAKSIEIQLLNAGFLLDDVRNGVYIIGKNDAISPAFIPNIISRVGKLQVGGGIGLYFENFEKKWRESLSRKERRIDRSLPMIIAIDNFMEFVDAGVFRPISSDDEIKRTANTIYNKCLELPRSIDDFSECLDSCIMLNKQIFQYIHCYSEIDEVNFYFSKSASFMFWLETQWPELSRKMFDCLDKRTSNMMSIYRRDMR